jgi:uncharacterized membrane protein
MDAALTGISSVLVPLSAKLSARLTKKKTSFRFPELDALRGSAIILMIFLHLLWDLDYFGIMPLNHDLYQIQFICPFLFLLLVGICLSVSYNKANTSNRTHSRLLFRGFKIFLLGVALSVITFILLPDRPIIFGVLHCIGCSIMLSVVFLRFKTYALLPAVGIIIIGLFFGTITVSNPTVIHLALGLHQQNVWSTTIDYFPLFPWFGVTLLGIAVGNVLYKDNKRQFHLPNIARYTSVNMMSWLGKHSLLIYLLHQPLIAGLLQLYLFL